MSRKKHSPITHLAPLAFRSSFGDLIGVGFTITFFDQTMIDSIFEKIMWFGRTKQDYDNFERSARAAYHFLEKGNQVKPKEIAKQFYAVIGKVTLALNKAILAQEEATQVPEDDADAKIQHFLEYYKVMYEGLLPLICAPVLYAFGISKNIRHKAFTPSNDGRVNLKAINKMEKWLAYPEKPLARGLNGHIRNAYAHETYRILDGARVELWDNDPYKPHKSWGPETWQLDQLVNLCDQLWVNALGIICALVLYDVNNQRILADRGWIPPVEYPKLRKEELSATIEAFADELGFYLKSLELLPNKVSITLFVKSKGITQEAELKLGYEKEVQLFKIPLWYEEKRVIDQITILLHQLVRYFETDSEFVIRVMSLDEALLGELATDSRIIISLRLPNYEPETVENIRHIFKMDTLKDFVTFVEKKGNPKYIGTRPVEPDDLLHLRGQPDTRSEDKSVDSK